MPNSPLPKELVDHIASLDNPKPEEVFELLETHVGKAEAPPIQEKRLCACGHQKDVSDFRIVNTGVVTAVDNVCLGCRKECDETTAHLCCTKCKEVFGHFYPGKEPSGFTTHVGRFYHTQECPHCSDKNFSPILEQILFYKLNNIPYKDPASTINYEKESIE